VNTLSDTAFNLLHDQAAVDIALLTRQLHETEACLTFAVGYEDSIIRDHFTQKAVLLRGTLEDRWRLAAGLVACRSIIDSAESAAFFGYNNLARQFERYASESAYPHVRQAYVAYYMMSWRLQGQQETRQRVA